MKQKRIKLKDNWNKREKSWNQKRRVVRKSGFKIKSQRNQIKRESESKDGDCVGQIDRESKELKEGGRMGIKLYLRWWFLLLCVTLSESESKDGDCQLYLRWLRW